MFSDFSALPPSHSLPWLASFNVGDSRIDGEHRALINCANEMCALAAIPVHPTILRRAGRELIALAEVHFESEEAMFPSIGYDDRQNHVREHLGILAGMESLMRDTAEANPTLAATTTRLLLIEHILRHDLAFKSWIEAARGD